MTFCLLHEPNFIHINIYLQLMSNLNQPSRRKAKMNLSHQIKVRIPFQIKFMKGWVSFAWLFPMFCKNQRTWPCLSIWSCNPRVIPSSSTLVANGQNLTWPNQSICSLAGRTSPQIPLAGDLELDNPIATTVITDCHKKFTICFFSKALTANILAARSKA